MDNFRGILTADIHLRKENPRCRVDKDWVSTQRETLQTMVRLANKKDCPIFCIGDLFDTPRASTEITKLFIHEMKQVNNGCYILCGNHDMIQASWNNVEQSSFGILMESFPLIESIYPQAKPFGLDEDLKQEIMFSHQMVFETKTSCPPNVKAKIASELLEEYPATKWIFTGDTHTGFHYKKNGRNVINPGCVNIQKADYQEYTPKVVYVDTEKDLVEWIPLPHDKSMVVDDYLEELHAREDRMDAFLERLSESGQLSLSFIDNLRTRIKETELSEETELILTELIEELGEEK